MRPAIIVLAVLVIVPAPVLGDTGNGGHMGYGDHMMGYGGGLIMWLLVLIVAAVVIYAFWQLARSRGQDGTSRETPLDILKKRFARGETTAEEFEEKKRQLMG